MYLTEKSLTTNKYPRQPMAVVTHSAAPSAALRPLAINLSCFKRMPSSDATTEYAVTTQASAKANWPNCAAMLVTLFGDLDACCRFFFVLRSAFRQHRV